MASSVFEGCAVDLSFAETEFKSAGNILSLKKFICNIQLYIIVKICLLSWSVIIYGLFTSIQLCFCVYFLLAI